MWPAVHVCAPDLHVVPATVGIRSAWNTTIDSFIKNQLMPLCGVECDLHPQVYSSPEVVVEVCLTGVNDQFMARCHSSCCSGHHSGIAVVAEVSPRTARDVTFRLRPPHFKPGGQWNDGLWQTCGRFVQHVMWTTPVWPSQHNEDKTGGIFCHGPDHCGEIEGCRYILV